MPSKRSWRWSYGVFTEHGTLPWTGGLIISLPPPSSQFRFLSIWRWASWLRDGDLVISSFPWVWSFGQMWEKGIKRSLLSLVENYCFLRISFIFMGRSKREVLYTIKNSFATDQSWNLFIIHLKFSVFFPLCFLDSLYLSGLTLGIGITLFLYHICSTARSLLGQPSVKLPQELMAAEIYQSHRQRRVRLLRATCSRAGWKCSSRPKAGNPVLG